MSVADGTTADLSPYTTTEANVSAEKPPNTLKAAFKPPRQKREMKRKWSPIKGADLRWYTVLQTSMMSEYTDHPSHGAAGGC